MTSVFLASGPSGLLGLRPTLCPTLGIFSIMVVAHQNLICQVGQGTTMIGEIRLFEPKVVTQETPGGPSRPRSFLWGFPEVNLRCDWR